MVKFQKQTFFAIAFLVMAIMVQSCRQVALVEQQHNIANAKWSANQVDTFRFDISDTLSQYAVAVVVRHTNSYAYRNMWVRVGLQLPGTDSLKKQDFNLPLATADSWLGVGMGDIFEVRPLLFKKPVSFPQSGQVVVTLQHIMRQDPLPGVMQIGVRVEPQ